MFPDTLMGVIACCSRPLHHHSLWLATVASQALCAHIHTSVLPFPFSVLPTLAYPARSQVSIHWTLLRLSTEFSGMTDVDNERCSQEIFGYVQRIPAHACHCHATALTVRQKSIPIPVHLPLLFHCHGHIPFLPFNLI